MTKHAIFACILGVFLCLPLRVVGEVLPTVATLIQSMQYHHPYSQAVAEGATQSSADIEIALSQFDTYVEQKTSGRTSGYYDGLALRQRAIKPLESLNASIFTEYRISDGDFPVYEQEYQTLSGGEVSIGVELSLLQNRKTDKRRVELKNAKLAAQQWGAQAQNVLNEFFYKGIYEYLAWYESALQVKSVEALLSTAAERERALTIRVEKGDLARVTLTEFSANIVEQRLLVAKLKQKRNGHARSLSYYWRDNQGEIISIASTSVPADIQWPFSLSDIQIAQLRKQITRHPQLNILRMDKAEIDNKQALAANALLPKLDLQASLAKDVGSGPRSLEGTESKVGLAFSLPIGNRKAKAEQTKLLSKRREIENKYISTKQSIEQAFEKAFEYWLQAKEIAQLQQQNASLAKQLSLMERQRFDAGDSDMFTLNARASNEIKAQMKAIETKIDLLNAELLLFRIAAAISNTNLH